jgi:hypothetical protein
VCVHTCVCVSVCVCVCVCVVWEAHGSYQWTAREVAVWVIQPNTASFICCALIYFRHRTLLLYLSNAGTEGAVIDSCLFTRVDGLGVFISGYNRNLTVSNSTFEWIGEHRVAHFFAFAF